MRKILLILNTVKYLKFIQIYYRIYYAILPTLYKNLKFKSYRGRSFNSDRVKMQASNIPTNNFYKYKDGVDRFIFLNINKNYLNKINWEDSSSGMLWLYNLCYFEYLNQNNSNDFGLRLINGFITNTSVNSTCMDPYTISLRGINWIKFLSKNNIKNSRIDSSLYQQYMMLTNKIEYHVLGNHILENAFSLLFAAYYFNNNYFYIKSRDLLLKELDEQIMIDGAHFELSPMYHQAIFFRVLDSINLIKNNLFHRSSNELLLFLINKAALMLTWINQITFLDGSLPLLNDSTNCIAPKTIDLNKYADTLKIPLIQGELGDSGYRKIRNNKYELLMDIGSIGPDYIPGHSHCDMLSFVLHVNNTPVIVDKGISTYEANETRLLERRTSSHNTVSYDGCDQAQMWKSWRVANRGHIINSWSNEYETCASHNGFPRGVIHKRIFRHSLNKIIIIDSILEYSDRQSVAFFHFDQSIELQRTSDNCICIAGLCKFIFKNFISYSVKNDYICTEYNKKTKTKTVSVIFEEQLITTIEL
jgi:hypothetical protein